MGVTCAACCHLLRPPTSVQRGGSLTLFFFSLSLISLSLFSFQFFFWRDTYDVRLFFFPNSFLSLEFVPFNQAKVDRCNLTKSQFQVIARLITLSAEHFDPSPRTSHQFSLCLFFYLFKFYFLRKKKGRRSKRKRKGRIGIDNVYFTNDGTECFFVCCFFLFSSLSSRKEKDIQSDCCNLRRSDDTPSSPFYPTFDCCHVLRD